MDSELGKSEKEFWLDCNKWSITFLVVESLNGSEILFEINYPSIKEFVIDSLEGDMWILNIFLDKCAFKLTLSAESRLIGVLRKRLGGFTQKSFKESMASSPIIVKPRNVKSKKQNVGAFKRIHSLLISESKAKWSRIRKLHNLLLHRIQQMHARHRQGIDSSE